MQFHHVHHVTVEGSASAAEVLALNHVERLVQEDAVRVQANAAEIGAPQGKTGVEVVIGGDTGKALYGAQRVIGQHACQILGVGSGEHQGTRAIGPRGFEKDRPWLLPYRSDETYRELMMTSKSLVSPASR